MKRIVLIIAILAGIFISCDNDDSPNIETPSVVLNTFQSEFPDAMEMEWDKIGENFEVEFEIDKIDQKAILSSGGDLLKYKYEIQLSELPEPVNQTIDKDDGRNNIDDVEILKIDGFTYYQIEFERNFMEERVIFNTAGEVTTEVDYLD